MKKIIKSFFPKILWEQLHCWKVRWRQTCFKAYVTTRQYGDQALKLYIADPLGKAWYDQNSTELIEIELLKEGQLKPGARVFDIGAHQGVVALRIAHVVGAAGKVVAIEANPHNAEIAERNRQLNAVANLEITAKAVSSQPGKLRFSRDWDGQSVGKGDIEVTATTVDELARLHGWPQVLYIDVEGFECEVLAGASETLQRRPDMYIEVHAGSDLEKYGGSVERLLSYLPSYRLLAVKPAIRMGERETVCVYSPSLEWTRHRFYLVALAQ